MIASALFKQVLPWYQMGKNFLTPEVIRFFFKFAPFDSSLLLLIEFSIITTLEWVSIHERHLNDT